MGLLDELKVAREVNREALRAIREEDRDKPPPPAFRWRNVLIALPLAGLAMVAIGVAMALTGGPDAPSKAWVQGGFMACFFALDGARRGYRLGWWAGRDGRVGGPLRTATLTWLAGEAVFTMAFFLGGLAILRGLLAWSPEYAHYWRYGMVIFVVVVLGPVPIGLVARLAGAVAVERAGAMPEAGGSTQQQEHLDGTT